MSFAIDLYEHLIEVPSPLCALPQRLNTFLSDLAREQGSKPINPEPDALMADIDAAFTQKVLDIP
ncbi:MAG: hypothetical protein ACFBZ9_17930 [Sphingomonadales bacterium]